MSKFTHLKVAVSPYYQNDLQDTYPNLARRLKTLALDLVARNSSLYEIARQLDKLRYTFDGTLLRKVMLRHGGDLQNLYKSK
jgi:hypothetical protein